MQSDQITLNRQLVLDQLKRSSSKIAPLWSLENFVAVNPFLGLSDMKFSDAMNFLNKGGHAQPTLPIEFYLEALQRGDMEKEDIAKALKNSEFGYRGTTEEFIQRLYSDRSEAKSGVKVMADVASEINGKKWGRFMIDRISFWASAYFDNFQAIWDTARPQDSLFKAWKREAEVDRGPKAMGLKGFRQLVKQLPDDHVAAAIIALRRLDIPDAHLDFYLNALLMKMNGWAGFAARIDWDAGLKGEESTATVEFLSILLVWEMCLLELLPYPHLGAEWSSAKTLLQQLSSRRFLSEQLAEQLILQDAFDAANQRKIIEKINHQEHDNADKKETKAQAIFCIDVRSEVFRRNLEAADSGIETLGFAGFFAFPINYVPIGHSQGTDQCPVLLSTSHIVEEKMDNQVNEKKALEARTVFEQFFKAWKTFKTGAISCFSFVSPLGLYFLPKLLTDAFGRTRPVPNPNDVAFSQNEVNQKTVQLAGNGAHGIPLVDRVNMAENALKAMSLTEDFARSVLIVGHGANTVNNPHATGLDCGACGGHSGEANAKVAAAVLNDREVRTELVNRGISIPETTIFIPALHDTTTDQVTLFNAGHAWPESHENEIKDINYALKLAGEASREERGARMKLTGNVDIQVLRRSRDWSQVRPEWGLAGCSSFIVAPRERTSQLNFGGKAFMHNYSWQKDDGFGVLELIMTAPMVVTSWINLQYYASTVDNKKFGAGNKTLHNVVGGLGVLEGFAGDLRVGLPWQSVHDGEEFQHEPQRLNVIIEAPIDEMSKILEKHEGVRQLVDNSWIYLFAMNDEGKVAYQYTGDLHWDKI